MRKRLLSMFLAIGIVISIAVPAMVIDAAAAANFGNNVTVDMGNDHSAAITEDGKLYCWGSDGSQQIGNGEEEVGDNDDVLSPIPILTDVKSIDMSWLHSAAITDDGILYCWGSNSGGMTGIGMTYDYCPTPTPILDNVESVSLSNFNSAAITQNGDLYSWGRNSSYYGHLVGNGNDPDYTGADVDHPKKILSNIASVVLEDIHSAAITKDGDLYCWGQNKCGEVGNGNDEVCEAPVCVLSNVVSVSLGGAHTAAITENGDLYCWGSNSYGQVGNGSTEDQLAPTKILSNVVSVSLGFSHSAAITENGDLYCWGRGTTGQIGNGSGSNRNSTPVKVLSNAKAVYTGGFSRTAAITENGDLYCWGTNTSGCIGNGNTDNQFTPVKVLENVVSVSLGSAHTAALTTSKDLYCWGSNSNGEVGNNSEADQLTPIKVLSNVRLNDTGSEDKEVITRTEYHQLKRYDTFTNTVIFEDGISYKWAHEDDWADIMALVGKWVRCTIEYSEQSGDVLIAVDETEDYFIIGRDSNWFFHTATDFGYVTDRTECQSYGEDSIGKIYPTSIKYYVKLVNGLSWKKEISLLDYMNSGKWEGSCQGLSLSMAMANIGTMGASDFNNKDETYSCYYELPQPSFHISEWNDYRLRDYITYCTLLQKTDQMPSSGKLTNSEKFGPVGSLANFITWGGFWDSFYDDVKTATKNQIPLLFGFGWNASGTPHGHTILTCGYDDSNSDDRIVKLYDCNSPNQYLYLRISRKEQSFSLHYEDGSIPPYVSNENWNYFTYWDMDTIQQLDATVATNSAQNSRMLTLLADESTEKDLANRTVFAVDAFQNFYLENSDGLYFSYDGNQYSGNMPIYDLKIIGEETQTFEFTIDSAPEFKITDFLDGCTFALFMGDEYNTASAENADCIRFIENDGIYFEGQAYTFSAGISSKETESLLRASGFCTGNSSITYSDTDTEMNTDGEYSSIQTQVINKTGVQSKEFNETFSSAKVDANGGISPETKSNSSDHNSGSRPVTYTVTTHSGTANGTVTVTSKSAARGDTVTITVAPDTGYQLDKLTVTDKNGNKVSLTDNGKGTYTFTMPASNVSIAASFTALDAPAPDLPFTDVTTSDWFYDGVAYVVSKGMMKGVSDTAFAPNATTTRGMLVTILYRLEGEPAANDAGFTDVESGAWYQEAVDWAAANGIVNGTSETTFDPNGTLTREQMAAILYRYAAYKGYDVSQKAQLDQFQDQSTVSGYAEDALSWANAAGLITGVTDTTLSPKGSAVRAQTATILMRFCESVVK